MLQKFVTYSKQKIKAYGRLSYFTNSFIPPCNHHVSDVSDFTNTRHVIARKFSSKPLRRFRCYTWIRAVHYNLNVPYICTQYVSFTPSQRWKFVNHNGAKMVNIWNVNKLTETRTKMEVGKLGTRVTQ